MIRSQRTRNQRLRKMSKKTFEKLYYEAHRPSPYAGADKLLQATKGKYSRQSAIE